MEHGTHNVIIKLLFQTDVKEIMFNLFFRLRRIYYRIKYFFK